MIKFVAGFIVCIMTLAASAEIVERIVAIVNSEVILESDLKKMLPKLKKHDLIYDYLIPGDEASFFKGDRKQLLEYMINEKIMDSEIKKLNLTVTYDKVDQEIKEIAKRNNINTQQVLDAITGEGLSVSEYKDSLKSRLERQSLIESEIISKLRISDEDAYSEYLRKKPGSHASVNEYSVAHIFFNPKKGSPQAALKRAEEVLEKLNSGQSFEALAQQYSEDPNFSSGGFLGNFKTGEFLKELEDAVVDLAPGKYSPIVKSRMGYHIVKLLTKKVSTDPQFEKEKEKIKSQIFDATFRRQLKLWLQTKRDESFIRINEPNP
jgi:parvulin-like peptidyl-prolyl isomerase